MPCCRVARVTQSVVPTAGATDMRHGWDAAKDGSRVAEGLCARAPCCAGGPAAARAEQRWRRRGRGRGRRCAADRRAQRASDRGAAAGAAGAGREGGEGGAVRARGALLAPLRALPMHPAPMEAARLASMCTRCKHGVAESHVLAVKVRRAWCWRARAGGVEHVATFSRDPGPGVPLLQGKGAPA